MELFQTEKAELENANRELYTQILERLTQEEVDKLYQQIASL